MITTNIENLDTSKDRGTLDPISDKLKNPNENQNNDKEK